MNLEIRDRRGQAAMEFLMTYGWAILAAIIAIGVLYLIIGNPGNLLGDRYTLNDPFLAKGKSATAGSNEVVLEFTNGAGETVNISTVYVENCGSEFLSWSMPADNTSVVHVNPCSPPLGVGDRIRGDIIINFTTSGSAVTQTVSGSLNLKVA